MLRTCSRCGPGDPAFPSVPTREYTVTEAEAAAEYWFCPRCQHEMAHPKPENEDAYRERLAEYASHAAEDREARQRRLGMLDGKGHMWWGNGRLM